MYCKLQGEGHLPESPQAIHSLCKPRNAWLWKVLVHKAEMKLRQARQVLYVFKKVWVPQATLAGPNRINPIKRPNWSHSILVEVPGHQEYQITACSSNYYVIQSLRKLIEELYVGFIMCKQRLIRVRWGGTAPPTHHTHHIKINTTKNCIISGPWFHYHHFIDGC